MKPSPKQVFLLVILAAPLAAMDVPRPANPAPPAQPLMRATPTSMLLQETRAQIALSATVVPTRAVVARPKTRTGALHGRLAPIGAGNRSLGLPPSSPMPDAWELGASATSTSNSSSSSSSSSTSGTAAAAGAGAGAEIRPSRGVSRDLPTPAERTVLFFLKSQRPGEPTMAAVPFVYHNTSDGVRTLNLNLTPGEPARVVTVETLGETLEAALGHGQHLSVAAGQSVRILMPASPDPVRFLIGDAAGTPVETLEHSFAASEATLDTRNPNLVVEDVAEG